MSRATVSCTDSRQATILLDEQVCYQAMQANDPRFDGHFFVGVRTTGVFCRSVCPARLPKRENCTFYPSAGAAQAAGYRPCLRCRPELAPVVGLSQPSRIGDRAVGKALDLIEAGALDEGSVTDLAARLGVSERTLRQQFARYVGTSPAQVAKTRRLLFAKRLIDETSLSMTEISMSAGFKSIRSFNSAFQKTYGCAPSAFRRTSGAWPTSSARRTHMPPPVQLARQSISLKLPFSTPYNWDALMAFWQPRSVPGLEVATASGYCRGLVINGQQGWVEVKPVAHQSYLQVTIGFPQVSQLGKIMARLRRMFDVGVDVVGVERHLARSPLLKALLDGTGGRGKEEQGEKGKGEKGKGGKGLRIPGAWDAFELAVRAIVGQQVSVAAATTVFGRLAHTYGEALVVPGQPAVLTRVFPSPAVLAQADLTEVGLVKSRARAIACLAKVVTEHPGFFEEMTTLEGAVRSLCALPGIGPWSAHYIAMRALNEPDALPSGDLALLRAAKRLGYEVNSAQLHQLAEAWRPWRSYGAMYLWQFDAQR